MRRTGEALAQPMPGSLMREVDAVARFAPTEHEFTVTTAARHADLQPAGARAADLTSLGYTSPGSAG
ncbi:hypothetical protein ACIBEA_16310 [Streptomyces sp. NPDC051555]|uniref:hypothetical protein n=1 Tax=Streptomyces sp. NPDC051555 TaxID=3365657 RepID=UPI0037B2E273